MSIQEKNQTISIDLDPETAEGIYSNLAVITHSSSEFVMDFIRVMPGMPKANVKSRIVMNPEHAKRLMFALQENIKKFEAQNGPIKNIGQPQQAPMPMGFNGPKGEA